MAFLRGFSLKYCRSDWVTNREFSSYYFLGVDG
jgi:hypothetical protein